MTAHPNSFDFMGPQEAASPVLVRPKVVERYWGYEVGKNEMEFDLAVLGRLAACLVMIGAFVAAVGVWFFPQAVFAGVSTLSKLMTSLVLLGMGGALLRSVVRSTRIRVQIDTANGELREVVAGPFGTDVVMAHYGFDAVESVQVVASKLDPNIGQIQIGFKGGLTVPVGDGTMIALRHLRDRVATDCGLESKGVPSGMFWTGPLQT